MLFKKKRNSEYGNCNKSMQITIISKLHPSKVLELFKSHRTNSQSKVLIVTTMKNLKQLKFSHKILEKKVFVF